MKRASKEQDSNLVKLGILVVIDVKKERSERDIVFKHVKDILIREKCDLKAFIPKKNHSGEWRAPDIWSLHELQMAGELIINPFQARGSKITEVFNQLVKEGYISATELTTLKGGKKGTTFALSGSGKQLMEELMEALKKEKQIELKKVGDGERRR